MKNLKNLITVTMISTTVLTACNNAEEKTEESKPAATSEKSNKSGLGGNRRQKSLPLHIDQ